MSDPCYTKADYDKVVAERDRLEKELTETRECLGRETHRLIHERDRYRADVEDLRSEIRQIHDGHGIRNGMGPCVCRLCRPQHGGRAICDCGNPTCNKFFDHRR